MKIKIDIENLSQTKEFARVFAKTLVPSTIVLLKGDLGSGKTTFVKEVVKSLGCEDLVTSPTFTLLNTYNAKFPVYHFDMYRLSSFEEAMSVGFEEYFDKKSLDGVCFVEWPENVDGLIEQIDYVLEFEKKDGECRTIYVKEFENVDD